jgi:Mycothiol maleylpyruvate isomerase N-terminal domain
MSEGRAYIAENTAQRERLRALISRLGDAELGRAMPAGWTVAGVLGHLAFWDQRILMLLEQWRTSGPDTMPRTLHHADVDWINDAVKPMLLAVPPRRAAELAMAIAEAADRAVADLPDVYVALNASAGSPINLLRAEHRREHLDEIEHALASRAA